MFRTFMVVHLLMPVGIVAAAEEVAEPSFFLPTPEGWRTETIPFPLEFAPEIKYEGLEELRFALGMMTRSWTL